LVAEADESCAARGVAPIEAMRTADSNRRIGDIGTPRKGGSQEQARELGPDGVGFTTPHHDVKHRH